MFEYRELQFDYQFLPRDSSPQASYYLARLSVGDVTVRGFRWGQSRLHVVEDSITEAGKVLIGAEQAELIYEVLQAFEGVFRGQRT